MYDIFDIANWFLSKSPMTHKKLQKLCYYAQAWSFALKDEKLVDDEFQAWVHGPVSPRLYKKYRNNNFENLKLDPAAPEADFPVDDLELLESVWETYGDSTGNALEVQTHEELPWKKARAGIDARAHCTNAISPEDMRDYYQSIYIGGADGEA
jgi:uncharacterized phage-associated protein